MTTIDDFNVAVAHHTKRGLTMIVTCGTAGLGCLAVTAWFSDTLRGFCDRSFGEAAAEILMGLSPMPSVVVLFAGILMFERSTPRDPRLFCPTCGKSLASSQQIVVATRNCGFCGARVLAEPVNMTSKAQGACNG
jgi:hypothetical protein